MVAEEYVLMTEAQSTALAQITELAREHFDSALFVFETDAEDANDPTKCWLSYRVCGSFATAIGLARYAERKMIREEE